jgi:hypothetical protein
MGQIDWLPISVASVKQICRPCLKSLLASKHTRAFRIHHIFEILAISTLCIMKPPKQQVAQHILHRTSSNIFNPSDVAMCTQPSLKEAGISAQDANCHASQSTNEFSCDRQQNKRRLDSFAIKASFRMVQPLPTTHVQALSNPSWLRIFHMYSACKVQ